MRSAAAAEDDMTPSSVMCEKGFEDEKQKRVTMSCSLSKYTPTFLLLALFGLIFLLRNILTLENLNCQTVSRLYQFQSSIHSAFTQEETSPLLHNHSFCGHLGQQPSPEEALEERYLLDSISWPEPPANSSSPMPLQRTSDPVRSLFVILPAVGGRREWHVGEQLEVLIQMHDFEGRPKRYGGDFLVARLHSPELSAGVAGRVLDHRNGFYSALLPLPWEGPAQVEVTLVHPSEGVAVLHRLREERPDKVFFKSLFRSDSLSETTVCNVCLPPGKQPLCNFTDLHSGEPWYCYKPKLLSCDTRVNHFKGGYQKYLITDNEALFFQSGVNLKVQIHASGLDRVTVLPKTKDRPEPESSSSSTLSEPVKVVPSGYYYGGSWRPLGGVMTMHQFNESSAIVQCLKGKVVNMYGDSTVRQWFEYLNAFVPDLKEFNLHSPKKIGPFMMVDSTHNILVKYRCHGPPIRFNTVDSSELRYIANELDGLPGGPDTVVVVSIWSHFSTFPVEIYIRRLRHIRRALVRLLNRAPQTFVVIRSANFQALDQEVSLYNSDWYSVQLDAVLRAMFKEMDVLLVDAWEMTLAHHLPHALHPPPAIIKNMMDVLLSYVCPEKKKD